MSTALDVEFKMCAIHKVNTLMRNTVFPSNANISVSSITLFHSRDNAHCTLHNTMQCNAMQCNSQCPSSNWKQFWFHCWNSQRMFNAQCCLYCCWCFHNSATSSNPVQWRKQCQFQYQLFTECSMFRVLIELLLMFWQLCNFQEISKMPTVLVPLFNYSMFRVLIALLYADVLTIVQLPGGDVCCHWVTANIVTAPRI